MARKFDGIAALKSAVGEHMGYSDWHEITQAQVDKFADATGDHQWIHVDADRAKDGPFGTTIAHGYLTLSLTSFFGPEIFDVSGVSMGINYGLDKVRFPAPVPVGSRLRAGAELVSADDVTGGLQTVVRFTFEVEGGDKPVCVADAVSRWYA